MADQFTDAPPCYINGDAAEYTGNMRELHGRVFYELRIVEGRRSGELAGTYIPPTARQMKRNPGLWTK